MQVQGAGPRPPAGLASLLRAACVLQAVHLLDVASQRLTYITSTPEPGWPDDPRLFPGSLTFTRDDKHLLTVWCLGLGVSGCRCDVHTLTGHTVCHFHVPEVLRLPTEPAHCLSNRVAIACGGAFGLWDALSGTLLGIRRPGYEDASLAFESGMPTHNGLVAANRSGTKVAFSSAWPPETHLYGIPGLEAQACILPDSAVQPRSRPLLLRLVHDVYGWAFTGQSAALRGERLLHFLRPCACDRLCRVTLECRRHEVQHADLSPGGEYLASFQPHDASMRVYDTRTGELMATHAMALPPVGVSAEMHDRHNAVVCRSSCGQLILVRMVTTGYSEESKVDRTWEHLLVVQL